MVGKKYKYLFRLISVMLIGLTIPLLVLMTFFLRKSYEEVKRKDTEYYESVTNTFLNQFEQDVSELKNHTSNLVAESRKANSIFFNGKELFRESAYWYYEALEEFEEKYAYPQIGNCKLYYYHIDSVLTWESKLTLEQYVAMYMRQLGYSTAEQKNEKTNLISKRVNDFFSLDNWENMRHRFLGGVTEEKNGRVILLGYQTLIGRHQDEVLIFYEIKNDEFIKKRIAGYEKGLCFYLLDSETDELLIDISEEESIITSSMDGESLRSTLGSDIVFEKTNLNLGLTCITAITDESRQSRVEDFYRDIQGMMALLTLFIVCCCIVALYVEYKPVYGLMKELEAEESDEDEFSAIRSSLSKRDAKIQEQKMLIMDLFVNHLLYGMSISSKRLKCLGVNTEMKNYCVYLLENKVLMTGEAERLTERVSKKCQASLYVTDMQEEEQTVIIAFLNCEAKIVEEEIAAWLRDYFSLHVLFTAGKVVEHLDEIKISYRVCMEKKHKREKRQNVSIEQMQQSTKENRQKELEEKILRYLEVHYRDQELSQSMVAEEFHISNYTLSRIFRNQVGVGYTDYINAKRLDYAKEMLLTTDLSVREIAVSAGYMNENYFSRIFKATVGVSASEFRECDIV